jgi:lipopolysaccharide transport system permease protein
MSKNVIIYQPDNSIKKGYIAMFREIFAEIKRNRWLTWQLFKRDFFGAYKQSIMGILWLFIVPLTSVATFILLNNAGIFHYGDIKVPYPVYAMLGIAFWQLFSMGVVGCGSSLVGAGSLLTQINFSKKSLTIASMARAFVSFLVMLVLVAILFLFYYLSPKVSGIAPSMAILLTPLVVIPIILLALGVGFFLAIFNSIVRDIGSALSILLTFMMFLTPVLYMMPSGGILATLTTYNPMYYLIEVPRNLVLVGAFTHWLGFLCATVISIFVFFAGLIVFHQTESRITERV